MDLIPRFTRRISVISAMVGAAVWRLSSWRERTAVVHGADRLGPLSYLAQGGGMQVNAELANSIVEPSAIEF
jgi:hypothetical protein